MYNTENNTPKSEIDQRIAGLQNRMAENDIEAALFLQRADLFYFSGTIQEAHLFIPVEGEPVLMVYKNFDRAIAESPLSRIAPLSSPKAIPEILQQFDYRQPQTMGMELDVLPANLYFNYRRMFAGCDLVDVTHLIRLVRAIKSPYEIEMMRAAARLSDDGSAISCWTAQISIFRLNPLTEAWPRDEHSAMCDVARRTASEMRVSPGLAISSKREARLTVSPMAV